ncbi:MAG: macro domain-containing protein [Bdellovibrionales bacterium]|nr:macro domain-containing protein [Bdellovibrionales bacterium]
MMNQEPHIPRPLQLESDTGSALPCSPSPGKSQAEQKRTGPSIERVEGNLLDQKVDAIVNAWNRNLIPYWLLVTQGVSRAIKRAAGTEPFQELRTFGVLPLGASRLTGAGELSDQFKGIIHSAGINHAWRSSEDSVRECVRTALRIAEQQGFESVAFPAIGAGSSGIWGISEKRSLEIIEDQARRSSFSGKVVLVKFRR